MRKRPDPKKKLANDFKLLAYYIALAKGKKLEGNTHSQISFSLGEVRKDLERLGLIKK